MKTDLEGLKSYWDTVFSRDSTRAHQALAEALNWLTAGIAGGAVVSVSMAENPNVLIYIVALFFFLLSACVRYYTLGIEELIDKEAGVND